VLENTVIEPYSLVTGSPGKVKKVYKNREEIDQMLKKASDNYVGHAKEFGSNDLFYKIKK
jgi:carbonic anhydrase/acetyltransferase-like protein (isoleucine patch superfamily)